MEIKSPKFLHADEFAATVHKRQLNWSETLGSVSFEDFKYIILLSFAIKCYLIFFPL